jgi:protein translocase SecG subunit
MILLEKIWVLVGILILFIILSTDPKSSSSSANKSQISALFASASDKQTLLNQLNWTLIIIFFILTLSLSVLV